MYIPGRERIDSECRRGGFDWGLGTVIWAHCTLIRLYWTGGSLKGSGGSRWNLSLANKSVYFGNFLPR